MTQTPSARRVVILFGAFLLVSTVGSLVLNADDSGSNPWNAPARAARKKNPIATDEKSVAAGKALYIAQCLKCHGDTGKGDGSAARELNPKPRDLSDPKVASQTDGALFWKITTGRTPMPTFEKLMTDEERWNVINYTRTLAPAQPAAGK